jgi:hypothetical protein
MEKTFKFILLSALLTLLTIVTAAAAYITDANDVSGSSFTDIPELAGNLDEIFSGSLRLYSDSACQSTVSVPLGSSKVPVGTTYYVRDGAGNTYSGSSCYIYANAVYSTLFGDIPYHGYSGSWAHSENVLSNAASASYKLFSDAAICTGALLRTTSNADGSYNGSNGHSIIILSYDKNSITYLEGNGDGKGLVRITTRSWDGFNSVLLTSRGYRISFVVQPTAEYLDSLRSGTSVQHDYVGYFENSVAYRNSFRDVKSSDWFYEYVKCAFELGLMNGQSATRFAPESDITVAEAATLAARILSGYWDDGLSFISSGAWYAPYYEYLALWGVTPDSFGSPQSAITRGDFARLMALSVPSDALSPALHTSVSRWDVTAIDSYYDAVVSLYLAGIITGSGGEFSPDATLTRSEAAAIVSRIADRALRT